MNKANVRKKQIIRSVRSCKLSLYQIKTKDKVDSFGQLRARVTKSCTFAYKHLSALDENIILF